MGGIKLPTAENDFSPACQHIHNQLMSAQQLKFMTTFQVNNVSQQITAGSRVITEKSLIY